MSSGTPVVPKLLKDTIYGIQKDVAKVALLALASIAYRALKDSAVAYRSLLLRGGPAGLVLLLIFGSVLLNVVGSGRQDELGGPMIEYKEPSSSNPLQFIRNHPLGIGVTLLTVFAIDRLDLLVKLERIAVRSATNFIEIAAPALHKKLVLGRPKRPVSTPRHPVWLRTLRWLLPSAVIVPLLCVPRQGPSPQALLASRPSDRVRTFVRALPCAGTPWSA